MGASELDELAKAKAILEQYRVHRYHGFFEEVLVGDGGVLNIISECLDEQDKPSECLMRIVRHINSLNFEHPHHSL